MGLPLACVFAKHGACVTVCDIDASIVAAVSEGRAPYCEEPGLADAVRELHTRRLLRATSNTAGAVAGAQAAVVIVPAHLTAEREIDYRTLKQASADVGRGLQPGTLVVYETTVSVGGTRRHLIPVLEQHSRLRAGRDFHVAYSPERVKANTVLARLETTPKVVGALDDTSRTRALSLYGEWLGAPVTDVGSIEAAEMTKLVGMLYRDVNIALANELASFCEAAGVDFERVRASANSDGESGLLAPGIGVGGHCTPVYPYFVTREARRLGVTQRLSEAAREINDQQPIRQVRRIAEAWRPLAGRSAHILGLAFRPGVKVDAFSPAYALRDELVRQGAAVTIEDPLYTLGELRSRGFEPGTVLGAEVVVLCTAHCEFAQPDFVAWSEHGTAVVLDGRNQWDASRAEAAGMIYLGVGHARPRTASTYRVPANAGIVYG
jgi:nucleotide sugar dehydrogenase